MGSRWRWNGEWAWPLAGGLWRPPADRPQRAPGHPDDELHRALLAADVEALARALARGADPNALDPGGCERPLTRAIAYIDLRRGRHAALRALLDAGADPGLVDDSDGGAGAVFEAVLFRDVVALQMLLVAGADPNQPCVTARESLFDFAEYDYRHERGWARRLPAPPQADDLASDSAWVAMLERQAAATASPPPRLLRLLVDAGARSLAQRRDLAPPRR